MARTKLIKFQEIEKALNVIEPTKDNYTKMKGKWSEFFGNDNPVILELGCGSGEYTIGLATQNPDFNYIGVDIKGERIGNGSRAAIANNLHNVAFVRTQIQLLEIFFEPGEVAGIWITFPDPQPNNAKKRLTSARFLEIYAKVLVTGGFVNLKTDSRMLYEFSKELIESIKNSNFNIKNIQCTNDLYNSEFLQEQKGIQTMFEKKYLSRGLPINFLKFQMATHPVNL